MLAAPVDVSAAMVAADSADSALWFSHTLARTGAIGGSRFGAKPHTAPAR